MPENSDSIDNRSNNYKYRRSPHTRSHSRSSSSSVDRRDNFYSHYSPNTYDSNKENKFYRSSYLSEKDIADRASRRSTMICSPSIWGPSPPPSPIRDNKVLSTSTIIKQNDNDNVVDDNNNNEDVRLFNQENEIKLETYKEQNRERSSSRRHHHSPHDSHSNRHHRRHHRHHSSSPSHSVSLSVSPKEEEEINKSNVAVPTSSLSTTKISSQPIHEDSEEEGPQQEHVLESMSNKQLNYGDKISKSEANAMAEYVKQNKRIPRRGEVGLTSDQIEKYEKQGFVMSGSRHKFMNAVRLRKENEVYTAEEKRLLAQHHYEEAIKHDKDFIGKINQRLNEKNRKINAYLDAESKDKE